MAQHRKHGDFVRVGPNHISINNPEAALEIYGHKSGFLKSDFYDAFVQVKPVVFNTRDTEVHQRKRKYMNPAFSARALSAFEPYMDIELLSWKRRLLDMTAAQDFADIDFSVWSSFAFGKSFGFSEKGHDPYDLIKTIDTRGEVLTALGALPSWIRPWMRYNYFDSFWSKGLRATTNLEKIGREAFAERKSNEQPRKDFLSYLFSAKDNVPETEMVAESISFIVGGSDTTSSTITNFVDIVSRDKVLQKRLVEEIDTFYPGEVDDNWIPSNEVVSRMTFLNELLREVMRVRPTSATGLERVTPAGGKTIAGQYLPEGTIVSVPTCGLLTDERIFEDAHEIRTQRWQENDSNKLLDYFLPFSVGPRACIGRNFPNPRTPERAVR
ncbi:hypothetical protein LTR51_005071 [Lithohypha guttulata]|uniref:Cytochrome P450 n=1 Tax=Lithohypha guttulata TaxID=1690604 RepID=A0AAN7T2V2_9EURO|nr:hypothetical protein LTR51_005071 [Lithohypha guttulata]KAK5087819.1 hypothetical protein LTR05_002034 [Lithohypha guttulata]